ncbi:MAG: hypothetical protein H8E60_00040 [Candidatus Marinimicrobia bacterium]|nr:hypothetical protein [Candidatus Neomarinimicrobiota bacterium]
MNVFVLNPGRTGSMTFIKACKHLSNYTSGHETARNTPSHERYNLQYPSNHIEADNRLMWFLGSINKMYGNDAYYVKLWRDQKQIVNSFLKRKKLNQGIIKAFSVGIMQQKQMKISQKGYHWAVNHYVNTINDNIDFFLKDKSNFVKIDINNPIENFEKFWYEIEGIGNLDIALLEFDIKYNSSK